MSGNSDANECCTQHMHATTNSGIRPFFFVFFSAFFFCRVRNCTVCIRSLYIYGIQRSVFQFCTPAKCTITHGLHVMRFAHNQRLCLCVASMREIISSSSPTNEMKYNWQPFFSAFLFFCTVRPYSIRLHAIRCSLSTCLQFR